MTVAVFGVDEAVGDALARFRMRATITASLKVPGFLRATRLLYLRPCSYRPRAQQGARANADICHAACDRKYFEVKKSNRVPIEARGAPAAVVAHL
jgi:hypothetical protein